MKMSFERYLAVLNPCDIAFFITIGFVNGKMLGMADLIRSDIASKYGLIGRADPQHHSLFC